MTTTTENNLKSFDIDMTSYKKIEMIYTDPATVAAIVETGIKVYNMFKRKKSGPSAELQYLRKIYGEIRDMRNDIHLIIDLLYDLKVYMDTRQVDFISNTLSSKINTINLFLIGWLENGKGNLEEQFSSIHETKHLLGIYGFAHIHVYMLAFQKELDLCHWLEKGKNFTETLLEESKEYFTDALNPEHKLETPAKRLVYVDNQLSELYKRFPANTFTQEIKSVIKAPKGCWVDGWKITRYTLTISGTIDGGFTFSTTENIIKKQDYYRDDCRRDGTHIKSLEKSVFEIASPAPNLDAIVQSYKDGHELYLHHIKSKLELIATINTVKKLIEVIDTWFDE